MSSVDDYKDELAALNSLRPRARAARKRADDWEARARVERADAENLTKAIVALELVVPSEVLLLHSAGHQTPDDGDEVAPERSGVTLVEATVDPDPGAGDQAATGPVGRPRVKSTQLVAQIVAKAAPNPATRNEIIQQMIEGGHAEGMSNPRNAINTAIYRAVGQKIVVRIDEDTFIAPDEVVGQARFSQHVRENNQRLVENGVPVPGLPDPRTPAPSRELTESHEE